MAQLQEYQMVRVVQLLQSAEDYDPWLVNQRPPAVGDQGYLLDILRAPGFPNKYVVEMSRADGVDNWLADFFAEELEAVNEADQCES